MKKLLSAAVLLLLISFIFTSCEKRGDPPALPPTGSMTIDFSEFFPDLKSLSPAPESKESISIDNTNWIVAVSAAGFWTALLAEKLIIPVASFKLAVENKPEYLDNKKWQWSYSVQAVGATYTARLTGQIQADSVKWEMHISREGISGFGEFKWYEGTSGLDAEGGYWILNQSKLEPDPMLRIDWAVEGSDVGSVKYTYIKDGENTKGSYIEYGLTENTLDAYYLVHYYDINREEFLNVEIEWSTTIHNGHVRSEAVFQDSNWHCWDANGNDISCNPE